MRVWALTCLFLLGACTTPLPVDPPQDEIFNPPQPKGEMCGGIMGAVCGNSEEFCRTDISAQCGAADQTGICSIRPEACTMVYNPVCGCDGQTYSNECVANSKGVSAAYAGTCSN